MRTIISFAALFASVALVQLGSGSLGPLDVLSGAAKGFSTGEIGLLGSAHFAGFLLGCMAAPRLMGQIGHSRTFAAMAAIGVISALLHPVIYNPWAWAVFRIGTGVAVAGAYTVIESWMHAKVRNANRGRVLGLYRGVDLAGSLGAQVMIAVLEPASYISYNIVAMLCCLSLLPLTLTQRKAPPVLTAPRLRPWKVITESPLGVAGVVIAGLTSASFRMVGPIFGQQNGLLAYEIGLFLAAAALGGALAQFPVGWLADKFDRRHVLVGLSAAAALVCSAFSLGGVALGGWMLYAASFAFGAAAFPLFSVSSAHANDFSKPDSVVELNASLLLWFAIGAIVSPLVASGVMDRYGPHALFIYVGAAHVVLILFGLYRMALRPSAEHRAPFTYLPRTSMILARLVRRRKPER